MSSAVSSNSLRDKFLEFFKGKGHKVIPSSSLVPENDPSVLFTTAGMQQFKRYYLFPDEAPAPRVATCQKCVRTGDIDEVGDETHLTFFEMLGNFSFGYQAQTNADGTPTNADNDFGVSQRSYFKQEAVNWAWEFLTQELGIEKSRIYATYFDGDDRVSSDKESLEILRQIDGLEKIEPQGFDDNFWSLGTEGSPGGPTVEFYVDDVEVWNLVFNEFVLKNDKYEPTELKGVDTGMGLERLTAVMQGKTDVYETDLFAPIISKIEKISGKKYQDNKKEFRIIADHLRASGAIIGDDVVPSNKDRGYVLRRLVRRAVVKSRRLGIDKNFCSNFSEAEKVESELEKEESKFCKTLDNGMKMLDFRIRFQDENFDRQYLLDGQRLFDLYQTYGFPLEISLEEAKIKGIGILPDAVEKFNQELKKHQQLSRTASSGMFKGGLADNKIETTRLHTVAHLLLAALREVLGEQVEQKGSNITEERLRFDFNNPEKLTPEQVKQVEDIVNEKIDEGLEVVMQEMNLDEAKKSGATGSFSSRYGDQVKIYTIGAMEKPFSREICGGPHVSNTSELGHFKITKEESSSSGVRRIKAVLE